MTSMSSEILEISLRILATSTYEANTAKGGSVNFQSIQRADFMIGQYQLNYRPESPEIADFAVVGLMHS